MRQAKALAILVLTVFSCLTILLRISPVVQVHATTTEYGTGTSANDGYVYGKNTDYATAQSTAFVGDNSGTTITVGQKILTSNYYVQRGFLQFDTSALGSTAIISSAALNLNCSSDSDTTTFTLQVRSWTGSTPIDTGDYASYGSTIYATKASTLFSAKAWTSTAFTDTTCISKTSTTKLCLISNRDIGSNEPTGNEFLGFYTYDDTTGGGAGAQDPYLSITYTTPVAPNYTTIKTYGWFRDTGCWTNVSWGAGTGYLNAMMFGCNATGAWVNATSWTFLGNNTTVMWINATFTPVEGGPNTISWTMWINNTYGVYNNTGTRSFYQWKDNQEINNKLFGQTGGGCNGGIFYAGAKHAIYVVYQNSSLSPWHYYAKAYDLNESAWTTEIDMGICTDETGEGVSDGHWTPNISVLPNGHLIYFTSYYTPFYYRLSTYDADDETNLTKLLSSWGSQTCIEWTPSDEWCYPEPLRWSDSMFIMARYGTSFLGHIGYLRWCEDNELYLYCDGNDTTYKQWNFTGDQPYLDDSFANWINTSASLVNAGWFTFADLPGNFNNSCPYSEFSAYLELYLNRSISTGETSAKILAPYNSYDVPSVSSPGWVSIDISSHVNTLAMVNSTKVYFAHYGTEMFSMSKARLKIVYEGWSNLTVLARSNSTENADCLYSHVSKSGDNVLLSFINSSMAGGDTDLYFLYSPDKGETWKTVNGTAFPIGTDISVIRRSYADAKIANLSKRVRSDSPMLDENNLPIVMFHDAPNENGRYSGWKYRIAQYSASLGTSGTWTVSDCVDQNGASIGYSENTIWGGTLADQTFMDPYFARPAFWTSGNQTNYHVSKYIRDIGNTTRFIAIDSDIAGEIEHYSYLIEDTLQAYEVVYHEEQWDVLGHPTAETNLQVMVTKTYFSKFRANLTCTLDIVQAYANVTDKSQDPQYRFVLYDSNWNLVSYTALGQEASESYIFAWLAKQSWATTATVTAGEYYWLGCEEENVGGQLCLAYRQNTAPTGIMVNNSFTMTAIYGQTVPASSISANTKTYENRTYCLISYPVWFGVRGVGIDEYEMAFNSTSVNTTLYGQPCRFTTNVTDLSGVSMVNVRTNNTGSWVNTTWYSASSAVNYVVQHNFTLYNVEATPIGFQVYANDTYNNGELAPLFQFVTGKNYTITTTETLSVSESSDLDKIVVFSQIETASITDSLHDYQELCIITTATVTITGNNYMSILKTFLEIDTIQYVNATGSTVLHYTTLEDLNGTQIPVELMFLVMLGKKAVQNATVRVTELVLKSFDFIGLTDIYGIVKVNLLPGVYSYSVVYEAYNVTGYIVMIGEKQVLDIELSNYALPSNQNQIIFALVVIAVIVAICGAAVLKKRRR